MKMTVETVRNEYRATLELVRGMNHRDVFLVEDKPVTVYAIRHYLSAMQVLFDRIAELEGLLRDTKSDGRPQTAAEARANAQEGKDNCDGDGR